jgi:hypothetical protein
MLSEIASVHYGPNWQIIVNFLIAVEDRFLHEPAPEHILLLVWTRSRSSNDLIENSYLASSILPDISSWLSILHAFESMPSFVCHALIEFELAIGLQ